jgi:hypothetical protein
MAFVPVPRGNSRGRERGRARGLRLVHSFMLHMVPCYYSIHWTVRHFFVAISNVARGHVTAMNALSENIDTLATPESDSSAQTPVAIER